MKPSVGVGVSDFSHGIQQMLQRGKTRSEIAGLALFSFLGASSLDMP